MGQLSLGGFDEESDYDYDDEPSLDERLSSSGEKYSGMAQARRYDRTFVHGKGSKG